MNDALRSLPAVGKLLQTEKLRLAMREFGESLTGYAARTVINQLRAEIGANAPLPEIDSILERVCTSARAIAVPSLVPVLNATGIILHTNLARAPLGESVLADSAPIVTGYSNLEYDLEKGTRGHRADHVIPLLQFLTGAEDAAIVNNNAAALVLTLMHFAQGREVPVSRGELIEIGGAFRIPEIMATSGARMVEVGSTNRTRLSDYENAIGPQTSLLFKAHKSNYTIEGFVEEVSVADLAGLAHSHGLPLVYDIGSGLLRKPQNLPIESEPDVQGALRDGADLVTFSGDKLLGGPQAGIIAGKKGLVRQLAAHPLMRALRVDKLTLVTLNSACRHYLRDQDLVIHNPIFAYMSRSPETLFKLAKRFAEVLELTGVACRIVASTGRCGGGTLPQLKIASHAVELILPDNKTASRLFHHLLVGGPPAVAGILREGVLLFDMLALPENEIPHVAELVATACKGAAAHG